MAYLESFKVDRCDKITIQLYEKVSDSRDGKAARTAEITDPGICERALSLLMDLPEKGEEMIKMGDVEFLVTTLFNGEEEIGHFAYYEGRLKTTDTSFYSGAPPEEKKLYELLMARVREAAFPGGKSGVEL